MDAVHRPKTTVYRRVLSHSAPPTSPLIHPASALICSNDPFGGRLAPSRTPLPRGPPSGKCGVKHLWPPRVAAHCSPLTGRPPGKGSSGAEGTADGSLPRPSTTASGPGPATRPANGPATRPANGPATRPANGPATRPANGPATRPANGPATRPAKGQLTAPPSGQLRAPPSGQLTALPHGQLTAPPSGQLTATHSRPANGPVTRPANGPATRPANGHSLPAPPNGHQMATCPHH